MHVKSFCMCQNRSRMGFDIRFIVKSFYDSLSSYTVFETDLTFSYL